MEGTLMTVITILVISISCNLFNFLTNLDNMNKNILLLKELEVKNTEIEELKYKVDDLERNLQSFKEKIGSINSLLNDLKD